MKSNKLEQKSFCIKGPIFKCKSNRKTNLKYSRFLIAKYAHKIIEF